MKNEMELTKKQIDRQDFVDNAIFDLMNTINPTGQELKWDISIIGELRDDILMHFADTLENFSEQDYYPYLGTEG